MSCGAIGSLLSINGGNSAMKNAQPFGLAIAVTNPWSANCTLELSTGCESSSGMAILPRDCHIWMPSQAR